MCKLFCVRRLGIVVLALLVFASLTPVIAQVPRANPNLSLFSDDVINAMAADPVDGSVIGGGNFTALNGLPRHGLAKVDANGSVDPTRNPGNFSREIQPLLRQARARPANFAVAKGSLVAAPGLIGTWYERGSSNISGRLNDVALDASNNHLYVASDGGNVWRADSSGNGWAVLNDHQSYHDARIAVLDTHRLLLSFSPNSYPTSGSVVYSDDGGTTWIVSSGTSTNNFVYNNINAPLAQSPGSAEVFYARNVNTNNVYNVEVFQSDDYGASFTLVATLPHNQSSVDLSVGLYAPNIPSHNAFLLVDSTVYQLGAAQHAVVSQSVVINDTSDIGDITGGIDSFGNVYLWVAQAKYSPNAGHLYKSTDLGVTWSLASSTLPVGSSLGSMDSSHNNPNIVMVGGQQAFLSVDAGATWQTMGGPQGVHPDFRQIRFTTPSGGGEVVYLATDGGLYEAAAGSTSATKLSLTGLNNAQYYSTLTPMATPNAFVAGSQDNEFQSTPLNAQPSLPTTTTPVTCGDSGSLVSGNNGTWVWTACSIGLVNIITTPQSQTALGYNPPQWVMTAGANVIVPLAAIPGTGGADVLLGGAGGLDPNHLTRLHYDSSSQAITATELPYNFAGVPYAVAISPINSQNWFVLRKDGTVFLSTDGGNSWNSTVQLSASYFFPLSATILPDTANPSRLYVALASSTTPVYESDDGGHTFQLISNGLNFAEVIRGMSISHDGQYLFAASDDGPLYFSRAQNQWYYIGAGTAPDQRYTAVEFIDATQTARFSTFGRGVWDFVLPPDEIFKNGFE